MLYCFPNIKSRNVVKNVLFADLEYIALLWFYTMSNFMILPLSCMSIIKHRFVEVGCFVQDLEEIPARYLPFLNLLIFGDISIFFVKFSKGGARTNNAVPWGAK
jgi:hypothetical protein